MKKSVQSMNEFEAMMLDHARKGMAPDAERREALAAQITAGLQLEADTAASPPATAPPPPPSSTTLAVPQGPAAALVSKTTWGVVSALALGFGAGYFVRGATALPDSTAPPPLLEPQKPATHHALDKRSPAEHSQEEAPASDRLGQPQSDETARPETKKADPMAPQAAARKEREQAAPTFYEELSYVRRAQSALAEANGALALGLMKSLDAIQPHGALTAERNVTKVLALCQLHRTTEATDLAHRILRSGNAEVYRRRLEGSCAQLGVPLRAPSGRDPKSEKISEDD